MGSDTGKTSGGDGWALTPAKLLCRSQVTPVLSWGLHEEEGDITSLGAGVAVVPIGVPFAPCWGCVGGLGSPELDAAGERGCCGCGPPKPCPAMVSLH